MNYWKNLELFEKILEFAGTSVFTEIVNKGLKSDAFIGLLAYGSVVNSMCPNDLDVLVVTNNGKRHFEIILDSKIPIEIEYIPKNFLFLPLKNVHWYIENWEYEIAKYVHGKIVYDPLNQLQSFKERAENYPIEIAKYLFLHRLGRCVYLVRKIKKSNRMKNGLMMSFLNMVILVCLAIERKIPKSLDSLDTLSLKYRELIDPSRNSIGFFDEILHTLTIEGYDSLDLHHLSNGTELNRLPFWYPAEVEGLRLVIEKKKMTFPLPDVICLDDL